MWKAILPGLIALVTVGLSLVSGEVIRREAENRQLARWRPPSRVSSPPPRACDEQAQAAARATLAHPTPEVALVIGNAAYPDAGLPLIQPVNAARALADALRHNGFDVELGENLTRHAMEHAIKAFTEKVRPDRPRWSSSAALASRPAGRPTCSRSTRRSGPRATSSAAASASSRSSSALDASGAATKLVVIDASRRNPFERRFRSAVDRIAAIQRPTRRCDVAASPGKAITDARRAQPSGQ